VNPQRENSMKNSDSTSKDHSMLFLLWNQIDTSKLSTEVDGH
jgi:hypothetical protein